MTTPVARRAERIIRYSVMFSLVMLSGLVIAFRWFGPAVIGLILGPLAEAQMRNALSIGEGRWTVFVDRPMSLVLLSVVVAVLALPRLAALRRRLRG